MSADPQLTTLRAALPVIAAGGYFNSGYTGPLCAPAHEAVVATSAREFGTGRMGAAARAIRDAVQGSARRRVARLLGAAEDEVALTHHTTDGMNVIAHGLDWRPGDNAVTTKVEHKGGLLPLGVLRDRRGVELRTVDWTPGEPQRELPRRLAAAIDGRTRLVVLSHVSYVDGGVLDLAPVIEAAHRHGAFVAVDGAQSAGVLPVDVRALDADAYAVSGQKWLCGPEGTGALYLHPRGLDRVAQTWVGWASVDTWELDGHFVPNPDVSRYEVGTRGLPQIAGFAAALSWHLEEVGTAWAAKRTADLAEEARQTLTGRPGLTVLTPDDHTGLLTVRTEVPAETVVRRMAERGFTVRTIQGYDCVRACVGWFHTADEVAALTSALLDATAPDTAASDTAALDAAASDTARPDTAGA
ncbi:L-cysteine/cystine lyase [Actinacidiphila alni]|uniref:L-cysteine/cystine lyase n=1 Tax=Actinacidiphila alni TaxID=380248 RepID=A0A1I1XPJ8_9ACTN|nr:aminotransferase class V-fold PLP-dependent enzyme [Actinacidiphila alni]SFE09207.1 L-cysteine/cystine lyase [Actinacidiphila alni]